MRGEARSRGGRVRAKIYALAVSTLVLGALFCRPARAQDEAVSAGREMDVSAGFPGAADGIGSWQNTLQEFPQVLGQNFDAARIGALARILGQAGAPRNILSPKATPSQNWRRVSAAVERVSRQTLSRAGAAVASGSLRGKDGENLSRTLADLASLGRTVSGLSPRAAGKLQKSLNALVRKENAAAKAAVSRQTNPNFDGSGDLPEIAFRADAGEIAQLRAGPPAGLPDLETADISAGGSARGVGAGSREAFRGPVSSVPQNLAEPLAAETAAAPKKSYSGPKPLPAPRLVQSKMETVGDALVHAVTHSYPGKPGADPILAVVDFVNRYVKDKSLPNSEKHLILKYYEMNDSRLYAAIAAAAKARIKVTLITDLNEYLVGQFGKGVHSTWDFERAPYKKSLGGAFLRKLRALGFTYNLNKGRLTVLSGVPLFDPKVDRENPIMHDKVAVALGPDGSAYPLSVVGTANLSQVETESKGQWPTYGGRYNRFFLVKDPAAIGVDWEHALAEEQAYNLRLGAKGLTKQDRSPVRVVYKDGSYQEIAFTDGIQNPNDRITDLLTRATDPKNGIEIDEIVFSHFVLTDTGEVQALRKLMAAQAGVKVFGVFDQMFIPLNGYGLAGALANFLVQRPLGRAVYPFSAAAAKRMTLLGYQRLLDGSEGPAPSVGDDGDPAGIHLWHDKTTLVKTAEVNPRTGKKVPYVYVFTRTLNDSNHYENLESQVMIKMLASAPLAQEIENSIKLTAQSEPQYALSLPVAIARDFLARFTGRSAYDIAPAKAQNLLGALAKADYGAVASLMSGLAPNIRKPQVRGVQNQRPPEVLDAAPAARGPGSKSSKALIARFADFLNWYAQQRRRNADLGPMTYQKAMNVGTALLGSNAWHMADALEILYYNSRLGPQKMDALMRKAWTQGLRMKGRFPSRNVPAPKIASLAG
ncbi:MAG TPA: hypothetical protein VNK24_11335 [Elusimicrobiota bacterium]|nr:hypothetical protein [Elusimicrobiota bacterium]